LVSGAKPNPKFHLADVPILRNLERIDNASSVAEMDRILKLIYALILKLSRFMTIGYGRDEGTESVDFQGVKMVVVLRVSGRKGAKFDAAKKGEADQMRMGMMM
jgi:hypothetical protein